MALAHVTAWRDLAANAIDDEVNTGTADAGGDLELLDGAVTIAIVTFQDPAFGASSSGVITLAGVPLNNTAVATGADVDLFEIRDRDNATIISGTVTATSGGGDIELTNTAINSGQTVEITSMTWTAPL